MCDVRWGGQELTSVAESESHSVVEEEQISDTNFTRLSMTEHQVEGLFIRDSCEQKDQYQYCYRYWYWHQL